ncbi:MAG: guanylate kinase [Clostridiales bacterium]|jgi:guanylate kinase|nr:guanylate kinase [Clostridiales bacterium]
MRKGLLFIISGPSGAGKGTIYNEVLKRRPSLKKSVSVTTRQPRAGEVDGVHYHFRTVDEYRKMIADGGFLETASVYENYYGTPAAPVLKMLDNGDDVMFEIDILGARQIKSRYPDSVSVYIMAPSMQILEKRLRERGTESAQSLSRRLGSALSELKQYKLFDYIVFNDDVKTSADKVLSIIDAEKCKIGVNEDKIQQILKENS